MFRARSHSILFSLCLLLDRSLKVTAEGQVDLGAISSDGEEREVSVISSLRGRPVVHVFILAGDDNVEGYAHVSHLHQLATNEETKGIYKHWLEDDGKTWKTRDDVFVYYDHQFRNDPLHGKLTVQGFGAHGTTFGPEVEFGHVMGQIYEEPVLLIKTGWSDRSLNKDFRPPYDRKNNPAGIQWFRMLANVKEATKKLGDIIGPEYAHARHEIKGLVWWHGYSDFDNTVASRKYGDNLAMLLTFLRAQIKHRLPILVGELGGQGTTLPSKKESDFREMQQSVVNLPSMKKTTTFVPTAKYVVDELDTEAKTRDVYQHYYGRADTMMAIGQAFALAMADHTLNGIDVVHDDGEISTVYSTSRKEFFFLLILCAGVGCYYLFRNAQRGEIPRMNARNVEMLIWGPSKRRRRKMLRKIREEAEEEDQGIEVCSISSASFSCRTSGSSVR